MDVRWARTDSGKLTRRHVVIGSALLLGSLPRSATAVQATPEEARQHPNRFLLSGGGLEIIYASSSYPGEATFRLGGPAVEMEFRGDQIQIEENQKLGPLVTVMTDSVADGYTQWLTLLLPEINLARDGKPATFSTLAIQTRHLTTIAGPDMIEGALTTYEVIPLDGTAELLLF